MQGQHISSSTPMSANAWIAPFTASGVEERSWLSALLAAPSSRSRCVGKPLLVWLHWVPARSRWLQRSAVYQLFPQPSRLAQQQHNPGAPLGWSTTGNVADSPATDALDSGRAIAANEEFRSAGCTGGGPIGRYRWQAVDQTRCAAWCPVAPQSAFHDHGTKQGRPESRPLCCRRPPQG